MIIKLMKTHFLYFNQGWKKSLQETINIINDIEKKYSTINFNELQGSSNFI